MTTAGNRFSRIRRVLRATMPRMSPLTADRDRGAANLATVPRAGNVRSGITVTAMWDPRRERMIELARPSRVLRLERGRTGCAPANRRRLGRTTLDALRRPVALAAR